MAEPTPPTEPKTPQQQSALSSILKAYWIPLTLFCLFILFQLVLLPRSYPPSHYDALGIARQSSVEEVNEAYNNIVAKWNSGVELPTTADFIKIQYSFELLTNPLWKRDYDSFGIDEHQHVLQELVKQNPGERSAVYLPLLNTESADITVSDLNVLSWEKFQSTIGDQNPLLIQVYSDGSNHCKRFFGKWKKIATFLGEIANTGVVELGDFKLASLLAEKKPTGKLFFRNGLPYLVAKPRGCKASSCLVRYEGELSVDAVTDWFVTKILKLPRIPYYTKDTLGPRFLAKSSYNKVKVLFFSDTGMRATPFVRQIAKNYQDYASFAYVLWGEDDYSYWSSTYDVETAPATVFLRDPGTKPVVYYGSVNSSWFPSVMEDNKLHELPQLRSLTSLELGCDARGYSRAGSSTDIWYCVILIGRPSLEMNQMREVLRRVQQMLSPNSHQDAAGISELAAPSVTALQEKRLTLTWLDGELQQDLCVFHLGGELSMDACGARRGIEDVPQVVMVRYFRNDSLNDVKEKKTPTSLMDVLRDDDDPVSQLVARYNGSMETASILEWISKIVKDGDSAKLPFYTVKSPELVPESPEPLWFVGTEKFISTSDALKQKIGSIIAWCCDLSSDPRIGPMLLLGAVMSFGGIWLRRSQPTSSAAASSPTSSAPSHSSESDTKKDIPKEWRNRRRYGVTGDVPPSMTDEVPKDAHQVPNLSDSDSE